MHGMIRAFAAFAFLAPLLCGGCQSTELMRERVVQHFEYKQQNHEAKAAERRACHDSAIAEREYQLEARRRNTLDSLRSTLALDLDQRFVVSELAVDEGELKKLMAQRDKDYEEFKKLWDEIEKQILQARTDMEARAARERLDALARYGEAKGCCMPSQGCFHKWHERPCDELAQRPPELPAKRPILPAEIPMLVRMRMQVGVGDYGMEDARIRRLPALPDLPARAPCERDRDCCQSQSGPRSQCPLPKGQLPGGPGANPRNTETPPVPTVDEREARNRQELQMPIDHWRPAERTQSTTEVLLR